MNVKRINYSSCHVYLHIRDGWQACHNFENGKTGHTLEYLQQNFYYKEVNDERKRMKQFLRTWPTLGGLHFIAARNVKMLLPLFSDVAAKISLLLKLHSNIVRLREIYFRYKLWCHNLLLWLALLDSMANAAISNYSYKPLCFIESNMGIYNNEISLHIMLLRLNQLIS